MILIQIDFALHSAGLPLFYKMDMYFIALVCPEEINKQVMKWKLWMKERFQCEAALRSPAHITLVPPFWMKPELTEKLHDSISSFTATRESFPVRLNNFSSFKPKVLFVAVVRNELLEDLQDKLIFSLLSENIYPLKKEDRPFHPHVTIATRDLHKKSFYEAWEHFKDKEYEAEWIPTGISLLRHNKKNWDIITTSQFK